MYLTANDVISQLPTGTDSSTVDEVLIDIRWQLATFGIVFDLPEVETRVITQDRDYPTCIYTFPFFDLVSIQEYEDGTLSDLVLTTDYTLSKHPHFKDFYKIITLKCPSDLSLTAKFGYYVDLENSTNQLSILIKSLIIKYLKKYLTYSNQNFSEITSSEIGDSKVSFGTTHQDFSFQIATDSTFKPLFSVL